MQLGGVHAQIVQCDAGVDDEDLPLLDICPEWLPEHAPALPNARAGVRHSGISSIVSLPRWVLVSY